MEKEKSQFIATGRRKKAIARIQMSPKGKGNISVNGRDFENYFKTVNERMQVKRPLIVADVEKTTDVTVNVRGGGQNGQAGAVSLGIARALVEWNPALRAVLRKEDLLTRDPRAKERKKYGRKGARRRFQWTKR